MTENPAVLVLIEDGVAYVTLNRPEKHNAFDPSMIAELTETFLHLDKNPDVQAVVLEGSGKSFSAGADLDYMRSMVNFSFEENVEDAMKLAKMFEAMHAFSKPLVGHVHGNALGGGAGLVAVCDYVLADEDTRFGFTEILLGLRPSTISPHVMERIGKENALAYFCRRSADPSGQTFYTDEALSIGLVDEKTQPETAERQLEYIVGIAKGAGKAYLRDLRPGKKVDMPVSEGFLDKDVLNLVEGVEKRQSGDRTELMDFTAHDIATARASENAQDKLRAWIERADAKKHEGVRRA